MLLWITLLAQADPKRHVLYGCDIDPRCIDALIQDASSAGFSYNFDCEGIESVSAARFGVAVINPAFSITLQSPNLLPVSSTTYGMYGPNSHALSHEYALEHALFAADVVIALLPISMRDFCYSNNRLVAEFVLPGNAFLSEGANVQTAVYIFGKRENAHQIITAIVDDKTEWPAIAVEARSMKDFNPQWKTLGVDDGQPTITLPVTGNNTAELHNHNRRIIMKFQCGLTQAKVLNGIYRERVDQPEGRMRHRYPSQIRFCGDGKFFLDTYLIQGDPLAAFNGFLNDISKLGGNAVPSPTLLRSSKKLIKMNARAMVLFRKFIEVPKVTELQLTAKRAFLLRQSDISSTQAKKDDVVSATLLDSGYLIFL